MQKKAYAMRISDWSSDVCSSDLRESGTKWCGTERRAVVIGLLHHFAAELPMTQLVKRFGAAEQHAQSFGAIELMAGKYIKVATQRQHIMAAMNHALGAIDHCPRDLGLGQG